MRAVTLCVIVLCLLGVSPQAGRSDEKPTLAELRQMLPIVWRQYADTMRRFEGTVHDRAVHTARTRPDPKHRIEDARRRVVGCYPIALLETGLERTERRSVSAVNQDYFFRINSHDAGLHWQIVGLEPIRTPPDLTDLVLVDLVDLDRHRFTPAVHPGRLIDQDVLCGLFLSDRWLPNILVDPRFTLLTTPRTTRHRTSWMPSRRTCECKLFATTAPARSVATGRLVVLGNGHASRRVGYKTCTKVISSQGYWPLGSRMVELPVSE